MHYLIPDTGDLSEIIEHTSRAGIPFHNPQTVRDLILATQGDPISVSAVPAALMGILTRHTASVFPDELPVVIMSVPGVLYQHDWASMGTTFPPAHYQTWAESTKRSGHMATTAEAVESRGRGSSEFSADDRVEFVDLGAKAEVDDELSSQL